MVGKLTLILGPMYAGKSSKLLWMMMRANRAGKKCILLKPQIDTRYMIDMVCTHDSVSAPSYYFEDYKYNNEDIIFIDEGQFIDLRDFVIEHLNYSDIVIAGLNGDYQQNAFLNITSIIPLTNKIIHLNAVCECGHSASFTKAIINMTSNICIGGKESFAAVCRKCL